MLKVLIVDDDPMVADINKKFVETVRDFQVVGTASNGEIALQLIKSLNPHLVILDIYMPKINGLALLRSIRKEGISVDVILVTAAKDTPSIEEAFQWGIVDYLVKPFELHRFKAALEGYKNRKFNFIKKEEINQEDIDKLIWGKKETLASSYDKGIQEKTMEKIKSYMAGETTAKSAQEVADALGLTRVTVRRYLEYLTEIGEAEVEVLYGTVGRPQHLYIYKK
ncbi:response regulator of citrate/malate metabolism [Clostridium aceticum]|uniref:Transcriptional regulatory protein n=1 Tax=Clostridium aceticum TaxID=84022 RepID=A0A0D8IC69_9CLOT|nr:response regulator [Clostridium aceticum]AKL96816.1 response regulator of citrate/malate metabolism [Clostridium aceticum]KJF27567.1 hypothetical protein TZ02_07210 [Clostridium aceticum]